MSWRSRWGTIRRVGAGQVLLARLWIAFHGDERARQSLLLPTGSLVLDVGAYDGEFTFLMRRDWDSKVLAFEPVPAYALALADRFCDDASVTVMPVALGATNGTTRIGLSENGSSAWVDGTAQVDADLVDVSEVIADQEVALLKINAEGAEFDILERLIQTGQINQVHTIQVQFHRFVPRAGDRRRGIRGRLKATHKCAWNVPWVWEKWEPRA